MSPPLALIGFMGCGKSTVGAMVAARSGAAFTDLDQLVEEAFGASVPEIFASRGEAEFRRMEASLVPVAIEQGGVIALGGGAPMDDDAWRELQARTVTVWLDAPLEALVARIGRGEDRPLAGAATPEELAELFTRRRGRYAEARHRVEADRPPEHVAEEVARLWSG